MSEKRLLSLPMAILVNINIMMGVGIFINTVPLSERNGALGAFLYPLMGLLVLPLIISIAALMHRYPEGGFYQFGKQALGSWAGFIAAWSYFTGKLASAILMIHVSVSLFQHIFPLLQQCNVYFLDVIVLAIFVSLNMLNIRTGGLIQMGFLGLKLLPVLSIIILGLWYFDSSLISQAPFLWSGMGSSLPLVLYAAMGFEATVSLSSRIADAQRNGPKAIYYSFAVVMAVIFLFQFCFFNLLGQALMHAGSYLQAFPILASTLFAHASWSSYFVALMHTAIACSALGGSYGILYSNSWNLYTLAQNKHILGASWFTTLSRWGIPIYCVVTEGIFCLLFLAITAGCAMPLQQVSALSSVIAYVISIIALMRMPASSGCQRIAPYLALISCAIFFGACMRNFILFGLAPLFLFGALALFGFCMFIYTKLSYFQRNEREQA